ncbi:MAG: ParB/RepB/Spo0J family partition protein, partial [bacterium]
QPLVVSPSGAGWKLIAGERRLRAAKLAGLKHVPAIIRESDDSNMALISLIENLQREDLNPMEEARGIQGMMKKFSLTQEEVALKLGKSRPAVANTLRLLKFPEDLAAALQENLITEGHARALINISDALRRKHITSRLIKEHISVRDTEKMTAEKKAQKKTKNVPAEVKELSEKLESSLATKVEVKINKNNSGFIRIYFFSDKELDRIIKRVSR